MIGCISLCHCGGVISCVLGCKRSNSCILFFNNPYLQKNKKFIIIINNIIFVIIIIKIFIYLFLL